jgi:putative ABC transport system permease protein
MWNITWKGVWSHRRRLAGTMLAVLLGVAFLTASLTTGDTMTAGFDGLFREANAGTDVVVRNATSIGSGDLQSRGTIDATLADDVAALADVAAVATVIEGSGQVLGADGDPLGGEGPPTIAANWMGDTSVNPWTLSDGRAPTDVEPGSPYEVVIDRATADNGDLAVGDETIVLTPEPTPVEIVGLVGFGEVDSLGPTTYTAFTSDAATSLFGSPGAASELRVAAVDGVAEDELRDEIARILPATDEAITGAELTDEMLDDIEGDFLAMFRYVLLAFAGISLVVATFSIHNTFSILIAQRTRESALLRAIGASRRQVLTSVVVEAIAIGVLASGLGLAAGYGLALALKTVMDGAGLDLGADGVIMDTGTIVAAAVIGIGSTLLASVMPARRASRVAPLEALRDAAVDSSASSRARAVTGLVLVGAGIATVVTSPIGDGALPRAGLGSLLTLVGAVVIGPILARPGAAVIGLLPRALRGQTGRLARRNAMRDPRRTASSASALMVGTAVVALFVTVGASIKATIGEVVDRDFGGDLVITPASFGLGGLDPALATDVAALPEVDSATGMGIAVMRADGETVDPAVADAAALDALLDLDVATGSMDDVLPGSLAVSERYADDHDLTIGDAITAEFADGASQELTVAATFRSTINTGDLIITPEDWQPHAEQWGDVVVLVDLVDGVSEDEGVSAVSTVTSAYSAPEPQTRSEYIDSIGSEIDQMLYFVYGMLGVAILIALMGIANTLSLSIHERTRELGLLRAVGQTRTGVRSTIRWESVIVAVFGTVSGITLGTFLGWGLLRALADQLGYGVVDIPVTTLAIVVALAAAAGVAASWRPGRRAARMDVLDAIATS